MKKIFLSLFALVMALGAWADSPLTSTTWWELYEEKPIMQKAMFYGYDDAAVATFICQDDAVLELRLAVVNCVGWKFEGMNNFTNLVNRYGSMHGIYDKPEVVLSKMPASTRLVFAYILALDDYFDVSRAYTIALGAQRDNPKSRAIAVITGLIGAQVAFDNDWCEVYTRVAAPVANDQLYNDISKHAIEQIMEYISMYECPDVDETYDVADVSLDEAE